MNDMEKAFLMSFNWMVASFVEQERLNWRTNPDEFSEELKAAIAQQELLQNDMVLIELR